MRDGRVARGKTKDEVTEISKPELKVNKGESPM